MTVLLEFDKLRISRGDRVLLDGLAGRVGRGDALHIRGANGIGKTSLLEVLCGLREPDSGTLVRNFTSGDCHWVGHRNALNGALTPFENLRFWCAIQNVAVDGIRGALREQALSPIADRPCHQLSAGQRRRAALARLSVARRALWFLDEPLSGLDVDGTRHWAKLLADHLAQGGAAVMTSHQVFPVAIPGLRTWDLG